MPAEMPTRGEIAIEFRVGISVSHHRASQSRPTRARIRTAISLLFTNFSAASTYPLRSSQSVIILCSRTSDHCWYARSCDDDDDVAAGSSSVAVMAAAGSVAGLAVAAISWICARCFVRV